MDEVFRSWPTNLNQNTKAVSTLRLLIVEKSPSVSGSLIWIRGKFLIATLSGNYISKRASRLFVSDSEVFSFVTEGELVQLAHNLAFPWWPNNRMRFISPGATSLSFHLSHTL